MTTLEAQPLQGRQLAALLLEGRLRVLEAVTSTGDRTATP